MRLRRFVAVCFGCALALVSGCPLGGELQAGGDLNAGAGDKDNPGQNNGQDNGGAPLPGGGAAEPIPAELVGPWRTILTYVPAYYTWIIDPGDFLGSIGVTYNFTADGQYRYELDTAATYFGGMCFRSSSWTEWGAIGVGGPEIAFDPTRATNVGTDSCGDYVFDDNAPTQKATLTYTLEQDAAGQTLLRLRFPSGEEVVLERCADCQ
ncbi:hypothetical protein RAS1_15440 [Phycisphaerae bacterium RAS1]|nr:hypothetical protein RAS1_15440 [Phycisphaerae bacterium RAS1]